MGKHVWRGEWGTEVKFSRFYAGCLYGQMAVAGELRGLVIDGPGRGSGLGLGLGLGWNGAVPAFLF